MIRRELIKIGINLIFGSSKSQRDVEADGLIPSYRSTLYINIL